MRKIMTTLLTAVALWGCSKDAGEDAPAIKIDNPQALAQTVYADRTEGGFSVNFTTTGAWASAITETTPTAASAVASTVSRAGAAPSWIKITPEKGDKAGNYSLAISLLVNYTGADRSAQIMISSGGQSQTVTVTQKAVKEDGTVPEDPEIDPTVAVTDITGVPTGAVAGKPVTLSGTVIPSDATNQTIVWSVVSAGTTGATLSGATLNTTAQGTVTVRATITNGLSATADYTKDFTITVSAPPTPSNQISFTTATEGKINFSLEGTGTAVIDWGDGSSPKSVLLQDYTTLEYTYASGSGTKTVTITGDVTYASFNSTTKLTSIDVSGMPGLKSLNVGGNNLATLNVSQNVALETLYCNNNSLLTTLTLGSLPALEILYARVSPLLSSLDLSGCPKLTELNVEYCKLISLTLGSHPEMVALKCSYQERLTTINMNGSLPALTSLDVRGNPLMASLDVSNCPALTQFFVIDNKLTSLTLGSKPALISLDVRDNKLTSLDISGCTALKNLDIRNNPTLATLDVSGHPALEYIQCNASSANATLNVSNCQKLNRLEVADSKFGSITIGNNPALVTLNCFGQNLTALNINGPCAALTTLDLRNNPLAVLSVSNCPKLTRLDVDDCKITSLTVSGLHALTGLTCRNQDLATLGISDCPALTMVNLSNNKLSIAAIYDIFGILPACASPNRGSVIVTENPGLGQLPVFTPPGYPETYKEPYFSAENAAVAALYAKNWQILYIVVR